MPESKHRTPKPRRELGEGKIPAPQTLEEGTGGSLSQGSPPSLPKLPQKSDGTAGFKLRGGGAGPPSTHRDSGCRSLLRGTPVRPRPAARPRPAPGRLRPPRASFAPPARLPGSSSPPVAQLDGSSGTARAALAVRDFLTRWFPASSCLGAGGSP